MATTDDFDKLVTTDVLEKGLGALENRLLRWIIPSLSGTLVVMTAIFAAIVRVP